MPEVRRLLTRAVPLAAAVLVFPASAAALGRATLTERSHPSIQVTGTGSRDVVTNDVVGDDDDDVLADDPADDETADDETAEDAWDDDWAYDETADDEASDNPPAKKTAAVAVSATCGLGSKGRSVSCAVRVTAKSGTATAAGAVTLSSAGKVVARGSVRSGRVRLRATRRALGHKRYVLTIRYRQAGKVRIVRRVMAL